MPTDGAWAGWDVSAGPYAFGLYYAVLVRWIVPLLFTCYRFRRMQVITPLEGVRLRFGQASQVFFTWSRLPFMLIFGGISLNAIAVLMAAVFEARVPMVLVVLGGLVTLLAMPGGSFGVAASDFCADVSYRGGHGVGDGTGAGVA